MYIIFARCTRNNVYEKNRFQKLIYRFYKLHYTKSTNKLIKITTFLG